jgi:hypothetical protein
MPELVPPLAQLVLLLQDAVHGAGRTDVFPFVHQPGDDLRRRLIDEPRRVQHVEHLLSLLGAEAARRRFARRRRPFNRRPAPAIERSPRHAQRLAGGRRAHAAR